MSRLINSSPAISSSGVRRGSNHGAPSKFQVSSIMQPTHSNNSSPSLEDGDSIPRLSSWSGVDSGKPRWTWLFASHESSHCQLYYSLTEAPISTDALAHSWPQALLKYAFPPVSLLAQTLCKGRDDEEQVLLVTPFWPTRTWFSRLMLLMTAPPWRILLRHDCSHVVLRPSLDICLMFPPRLSAIRWWNCKHCPRRS